MDSAAGALSGFEERTIRTVDGLSVYVRDYAPLQPETGAAVLCLHGLTRNSKDFEIIAQRIAACGRRVIVPDIRGRGRSAYDADPAHYVPAVYAQDVLSMLDQLSVKEAVFIGTSMGAIITMVIAALAPQRVVAAVLNDVGTMLDPAGIAHIGSYVGRGQPVATWGEVAETLRSIAGSAHPDKLDDAAYWEAFARRTHRQRDDGKIEADYDAHIALAFGDTDNTAPVDMTPLFQHLKTKPVLSIRGEISNLLTPQTVAHMREVKPDLVTLDVPNVGHAPDLDEPEAWDALLDFLARAP